MSVSPQTGFQEGVHDVDLVGTTVSELQSALFLLNREELKVCINF